MFFYFRVTHELPVRGALQSQVLPNNINSNHNRLPTGRHHPQEVEGVGERWRWVSTSNTSSAATTAPRMDPTATSTHLLTRTTRRHQVCGQGNALFRRECTLQPQSRTLVWTILYELNWTRCLAEVILNIIYLLCKCSMLNKRNCLILHFTCMYKLNHESCSVKCKL